MSGDTEWMRGHWPAIRRALAFAWIRGGWDANRDGVMEGVQHNTYDVEFYGPNPLCGIYYLGALRAAEEMARALGDSDAAAEYHSIFEKGSRWTDQNLFNGEYYIQKVRGNPKSEIAPSTMGDMGADNTEAPEFQLGEGCLADQLIGQYLADLAGLGALVNPANIRKTLQSIRKYNHRADLYEHVSLQRVYALNDEPALLVCDYGKVARPKVPFPYSAEAWTGIEYLVAAQFIHAGMVAEGVETLENVRMRFDGERRNPWDEPECGHHYARAMSAWSSVVAYSGFDYHAARRTLTVLPKGGGGRFASFWSAGPGWGMFSLTREGSGARLEISVTEGTLALGSVSGEPTAGAQTSAVLGGKRLDHRAERRENLIVLELSAPVTISPGAKLTLTF
jgi:non-lysosomal glucosylceramidase